jgi:hypothetical protein
MTNAVYFRQKAEQCRRLAASINHNDPAAESLRKLVTEFDAQAAALEAETAAAIDIGYGRFGIGAVMDALIPPLDHLAGRLKRRPGVLDVPLVAKAPEPYQPFL